MTAEGALPGFLRKAALIALPVGALGSVFLTLYAGRRNPSGLLMAMFAMWVAFPFLALALASAAAARWSAGTRGALHAMAPLVTLGSLGIYGVVALGPPIAQMARFFLLVPPASLLFTAVVVLGAALVSDKGSRQAG